MIGTDEARKARGPSDHAVAIARNISALAKNVPVARTLAAEILRLHGAGQGNAIKLFDPLEPSKQPPPGAFLPEDKVITLPGVVSAFFCDAIVVRGNEVVAAIPAKSAGYQWHNGQFVMMPAPRKPAAWMKWNPGIVGKVQSGYGDYFDGEDRPEGDGWVPLYRATD